MDGRSGQALKKEKAKKNNKKKTFVLLTSSHLRQLHHSSAERSQEGGWWVGVAACTFHLDPLQLNPPFNFNLTLYSILLFVGADTVKAEKHILNGFGAAVPETLI